MAAIGRRKKAKPVGWLRDTVNAFYTSDMIQADFLAMEPKDRFMARVALEPKHNINENSDLRVVIQLTGIKGKTPIQAHATSHALPAHDDDDGA